MDELPEGQLRRIVMGHRTTSRHNYGRQYARHGPRSPRPVAMPDLSDRVGNADPTNHHPRLQGQPVRDRVSPRGVDAAGLSRRPRRRAGRSVRRQYVYRHRHGRRQEPEVHPAACPREPRGRDHRDGLLRRPGRRGTRRHARRGRGRRRQAATARTVGPVGVGRRPHGHLAVRPPPSGLCQGAGRLPHEVQLLHHPDGPAHLEQPARRRRARRDRPAGRWRIPRDRPDGHPPGPLWGRARQPRGGRRIWPGWCGGSSSSTARFACESRASRRPRSPTN